MSCCAQKFHRRKRKVFVGIERGHSSCRFVLLNLPLDVLAMRTVKRPRLGEVAGEEGGIASEKIGLAGSELARTHEHPDRNPRPHNARLAAANVGPAFDAGKSIAEIGNDKLQKLRFFCAGKPSDNFFYLFHRCHNVSSNQ